MRHTIPEIKAESATPTNMTLIKGVNVISKAGAAHVMEEPGGDLRDHLNANLNLRDRIENI
jgi:hypothetical protein